VYLNVDRDCGQQRIFLGFGTGVSGHAGHRFRVAEYGAVHWRGTFLGTGVCLGVGEIQYRGMVFIDRGGALERAHLRHEFDCPPHRGQARTAECRGDYDCAAVLGLAVGWDGVAAGDSADRSAARGVRSHRLAKADGPLAGGLKY
jgi:hypothetical protein